MEKLISHVFLLLLLLSNICAGYAQVSDDFDNGHIESSLPNFSEFSISTEYYEFRSQETAIYLVSNGRIEFGNSDYLNLEISGARYDLNGSISYGLGDFNISYTKNLYSGKFHSKGFQGLSGSFKLLIPTGNSDYPGLFGHWIIEPSIYYSWLLGNENWFIGNRWRVFTPFKNRTDIAEPPNFIRFEPVFGYENGNFWTSITLDNRWVYNMDAYVLYYRFDLGIKTFEKSGFQAFFTNRIHGEVLFRTYAGIGYYHIL